LLNNRNLLVILNQRIKRVKNCFTIEAIVSFLSEQSKRKTFLNLFNPYCYVIMSRMKCCHACKHALDIASKIGRKDVCPHCRADLYCCSNCSFYDPSASKQCREPVADAVKEKGKANFCDYFRFAERSGNDESEAERSRKQLEDLFKA